MIFSFYAKQTIIDTEITIPFHSLFKFVGNEFSIHSFCIGFSDHFQFYDDWSNFTKVRNGCVDVSTLIQNDEWVSVEFKYKAKGDEKFVILGNFLKDAETSYSVGDERALKKKMKSYTRKDVIKYNIDNIAIESISGEICEDYELRSAHVRSYTHRHKPEWEAYNISEPPKHGIGFAKERSGIKKDTIAKLANEIPEPKVRKIVLRDLFFKTDSYELDLSDQKDLQDLILEMQENKKIKIHILGHTDQIGNADYNLDLSLQRANAVKFYLSQQGIDSARMHTDGLGESTLLTTQTDEASLQLNRRVEIEIIEN